MHHEHIYRLDLNLLKAFDALLRQGSVTRAAEELSIGQPAMSHALGRLRSVLGDPLFVRTSRGMEPTPQAQRIGETVARVLGDMDAVLAKIEPFDPITARHRFTLGLSDYIETTLLPGLLSRLHSQAPGIALVLRQIGFDDFGAMLDDDAIDMAIGYLPNSTAWHHRETLITESRRCLYANGMIDAAPPISLSRYLASGHVTRALIGKPTSFVDDVLASRGLQRRVMLTTPRYATQPDILRAAPLVATVPSRLAEAYAARDGLVSSALPFDAPDFDVTMITHARNAAHPPLAWLCDLVRATAEAHGG